MTDLQMWSLLVGFFAPLVIAAVQQPRWTRRTRALAAMAVSALLGGLTAYFQGDLGSARSTVSAILIVAMAALTFYRQFWKPTGAAGSLEAATSPRDSDPDRL